jgi:glycosyltransferase involved in cell wall biosynthesis
VKIAFIVQRYGLEVNGGAELLCRLVAERLAKYHDVEVLTTCAIDYMTWKNEYPPGEMVINSVKVRRFQVATERNVKDFNKLSEKIFNNTHTPAEEEEWMRKQGPLCTELIEYLQACHANYEVLIFITYLYYTTYYGLQVAPQKSILVPTAHDEPPIYLRLHEKTFSLPKALIYLTEAEKKFVNRKFGNQSKPSMTGGVGVEVPTNPNPNRFRGKYGIYGPFVLYTGRIDESKGCKELIEYFLRFRKEAGTETQLVLIGQDMMKVPETQGIFMTGFVSEEDKNDAIVAADMIIMPSPYESLSFTILEAWLHGKPVLANGKSEVLKEHCTRSNGGLYYTNYEEFFYTLDLILTNKEFAMELGKNGKGYAQQNYDWSIVESGYRTLFKQFN